jgi:predicted transcriptional regulator
MEIDQNAARQGLLKFIDKKGGSIPIGQLHGFSKVMYQAAHQAFSELMEGLVGDGLVTFSDETFHITDKGREHLARENG